MPKQLADLIIRGVAMVDRGANQHAKILFSKRADMPDETVETPDALKAKLAEAIVAQKKAEDELAELKGMGAMSTDLETLRKRNAEAEKAYAAERAELQKQLDERTTEVEKAKAEVIKIRQQRRREEFIKRAGELTGLPGAAADDFGELLDQIDAGLKAVIEDPAKAQKAFEKFNRLLTSWNTVVAKSKILEEVGRNGSGNFRGAEAQLDHLAKERAAASAGKETYAQAYAKVMAENPELYRKYLAEKES